MRKAVGAAALLALFLIVALLTFPLNPGSGKAAGSEAGEKSGPLSLAILSSGLADSHNGTVAVLRLRVGGNASLQAFCQNETIQRAFVLLRHPSVPGVGEGLYGKLSAALSRSGASFLEEDAASAANYSNSVILSVSGALPGELYAAQEGLLQRNSRVVALGALDGKVIDSSGNLRQENLSGLPENFEIVGLGGGEEAAIAEMVHAALVPPYANPVQLEAAPGNRTIAIAAGRGSHCRAVASNGSGTRFADSGELEGFSGRLRGPSSIMAGSSAEFYFAPDSEGELGRELSFTAVASDFGKEERAGLAPGKITQGYESRFSMAFSEGGRYVVRVSDQFARQHAAAYVEVLALEARLAGIEGQKHEFLLVLGGKPVDGAVLVSLDGGQAREIPASNGRLFAYAAPSQGGHYMEFSYRGASAKAHFSSSQESPLAAFAKYAAAGALALAAFYLLMRAGKKPKYILKFPGGEFRGIEAKKASAGDFILAYEAADARMGGHGLPMYADEIAACMALGKGKGPAEASSCLSCLSSLVERGVFCEHEGAYIPRKKLRGFLPWELFALRLVHDLLLEQGQRFCAKRRMVLRGRKLELCLFSGSRPPLSGMKMGVPRVILLPDEEALAAFLSGMDGVGKEQSMLRIAYWNGAILPVVASRKELEPLIS